MKKLVCRTGVDGEPATLAEFQLVGEHVAAIWRDDEFRLLVLTQGVTGLDHGQLRQLRPQDGRAFWDALDVTYAGSSTVWVDQS